jgi:hypothetical protein
MLVCKIEMWPGGSEARAREIGRVLISHVGGDLNYGHYKVVMPKSPEYAKSAGIWKQGEVRNFPRRRLGPHDLLLRALAACIGLRSPEAARAAAAGTLGDPPLAPDATA